jgi:hypothetical protein
MKLLIKYIDNEDLAVKFVTCYNSLLNPSLSEKEIKLVSILILYNVKYIQDGVKDFETRLDLINTKKNKEAIRTKLEMKPQELENYLSKIKKKDIFDTQLFKGISSLEDLKLLHINYGNIPSTHRQDIPSSLPKEQPKQETGESNLQMLSPEPFKPDEESRIS